MDTIELFKVFSNRHWEIVKQIDFLNKKLNYYNDIKDQIESGLHMIRPLVEAHDIEKRTKDIEYIDFN